MSLKLKHPLLKVSAFVFTCMFMFNAQAGMVNDSLVLTTTQPDIYSSSINTTYDFLTKEYSSTGTAENLAFMGNTETIVGGTFSIMADIDAGASGQNASGVLSIGGSVASILNSTNILLTGSLAQVGGPGMALNFLFKVTGGDASMLYGGVGASVGVQVNNTGYNGAIDGFNAAFNTLNSTGAADTFKVPVPNTIALFLIGFAALSLRRKLRA